MKKIQFTTIEKVRRHYEITVDDNVTAGDIAFATDDELNNLCCQDDNFKCEVVPGDEEMEPGSFREVSA